METFVGVARADGLFASPVAEVWLAATAYLFVRSAVVVGKAAVLPADVERLFGRGPEQDEVIRQLACRASEGAVERVGQTAVAIGVA